MPSHSHVMAVLGFTMVLTAETSSRIPAEGVGVLWQQFHASSSKRCLPLCQPV